MADKQGIVNEAFEAESENNVALKLTENNVKETPNTVTVDKTKGQTVQQVDETQIGKGEGARETNDSVDDKNERDKKLKTVKVTLFEKTSDDSVKKGNETPRGEEKRGGERDDPKDDKIEADKQLKILKAADDIELITLGKETRTKLIVIDKEKDETVGQVIGKLTERGEITYELNDLVNDETGGVMQLNFVKTANDITLMPQIEETAESLVENGKRLFDIEGEIDARQISSTEIDLENTGKCVAEFDEKKERFNMNTEDGWSATERNVAREIVQNKGGSLLDNGHSELPRNDLGSLMDSTKDESPCVNDLGLRYKFSGAVFSSFNEKSERKSWKRISLGAELKSLRNFKKSKESTELNRSQYSLVSCGELTAEAVQLWLSLPEEVKYDPALAPFRQLYEKEHGEVGKESRRHASAPKRLPLVNSAPHLNNNIHVVEDAFTSQKAFDPHAGNGNAMGIDVSCQKSESKFTQARHYVKMTVLLGCWIFFTLVFIMYNEKEHLVRHSSISPGEIKNYTINTSDDQISVLIQLSGPFLSENNQARLNTSQMENSRKMEVWIERWTLRAGVWKNGPVDVLDVERGESWEIILQEESQLDFNEGEPRSKKLRFPSNQDHNQNRIDNQTKRDRRETELRSKQSDSQKIRKSESQSNRSDFVSETGSPRNEGSYSAVEFVSKSPIFAIVMKTDASKVTPFTMSYTLNPLEISEGVIYACILLCGLYILIIFEIINRTMAALLLSTTSLATLALAGERPSVEEVISWLDVETLLLLFSMMLLVAIMAETGMFDYLAVYTFEVTKGKLWPLITLLGAITAGLSTFLDNVTTVLLMTPVTIRLCEVMDLDPIPILMTMVLYSNIGGTATPVGDPPNVIIASNKIVVQAGINFTNFTLHMTLGILLVAVQTYVQLRFMFRDTNKLRLNVPRDIQELRHQISIWRRAADSLPHLSKDQLIVRERLERKVKKLQAQLDVMVKESSKRACPKDTFQSTLDEMKGKYKIRDKVLLMKATVAIGFVVVLFFLHSIPELNRVSLGWTALLGAILLLLLADREDLEPILHRVEWSTLLFFAALFVFMEALSKLGLIEFIGDLTEALILRVDESARLAVALLLMLWVSGITSAFVDNIPLTTMMVRVVTSLGSKPKLGLPMAPLIWALSFGACLGGNGTLIGASANVVCAGVAEQHGYKFTFVQFFKIGFPIMIGHLLVASVYLLVCHCAFTWH